MSVARAGGRGCVAGDAGAAGVAFTRTGGLPTARLSVSHLPTSSFARLLTMSSVSGGSGATVGGGTAFTGAVSRRKRSHPTAVTTEKKIRITAP
jgi:hypothetical protein